MPVDTKEKILAAALELFSARGMSAVGTKAIAEAAGVNEVTVFRLFGSKDRLWVAVFQRFVVQPDPEFLLGDATGELVADLERASARIVQLLKDNIKLVRMGMMQRGQFPEIDAELESQPARIVAVLEAHLAPWSSQLAAAPGVVARTLVDALFGVGLHIEAFRPTPATTGVTGWLADFLPLFLHGALAPDREGPPGA